MNQKQTPITTEEAAANAELHLKLVQLGEAALALADKEHALEHAKATVSALSLSVEEMHRELVKLQHALPADKRDVVYQRDTLRFHITGYAQVSKIPDEIIEL